MKIVRVEATFLRSIPIQPPPFRAEPSRRNAVVVEVETDEGITGYSLLGDTRVSESSLPLINSTIASVVVGQDPMLVEQVWNLMARTFEERGLATAIAAVDVALWDIRGKALGLPVWRLLGGSRDSVETYITFGATGPNTGHSDAPAYGLDELIQEARFHAANGQAGLKAGVARAETVDVEIDFARMAAIREAVGPGMKLMMDARRRLSIGEAGRLCRLVEPLNITFFEDPVIDNDPRLLAELSRRTVVPLTANAIRPDRWGYRELLVNDATSLIQLNAAKIGFTESLAIASLADTFHKRVANGNGNGPHNAQFHGGVPNGSFVEYHYNVWMLYEALFESIPRPVDGWLHLGETPGMGLDPKRAVIEEHRVAPA